MYLSHHELNSEVIFHCSVHNVNTVKRRALLTGHRRETDKWPFDIDLLTILSTWTLIANR